MHWLINLFSFLCLAEHLNHCSSNPFVLRFSYFLGELVRGSWGKRCFVFYVYYRQFIFANFFFVSLFLTYFCVSNYSIQLSNMAHTTEDYGAAFSSDTDSNAGERNHIHSLHPMKEEISKAPCPEREEKHPVNRTTESMKEMSTKPTHPGGNFIDSYTTRRGVEYPVFRGPRGGFFIAGSDGIKKYLTESERRELNLEDYNSNIKPSYEHPKGVYTNVNFTLKSGEIRPIFRGPRGGCFYATPSGGMTYLSESQCQDLGLNDGEPSISPKMGSAMPTMPGESVKPIENGMNSMSTNGQVGKADSPSFPGSVFTGKYLEKKTGRFAVFKGPRGGFFYVVSGSKRYLTDSDKGLLGLN